MFTTFYDDITAFAKFFSCRFALPSEITLSSTLRISFYISLKAGLLPTNSLSFWLSGNVFILPSFWEDSFAGYRILGWHFYSLSTLRMSYPCFLASSLSAVYLMPVPLQVKSHFSLSALKIFLLVFDFQHFY